MDVRYTPEQQALRDAAARVARDLAPGTVAEIGDSERSAKLGATIAATGWRELRVDDEGRPAASAVEVAIVAEELARRLCDAPFLGPVLAADARRLAGVAHGSGNETVALRPDLTGPALPAEQALIAFDAAGAEAAVAVLADGTLILASLDTEVADLADLTRPMRRTLAATAEPIGALANADLRRWVALALAGTTADLVGIMQGALDLTVDYAKERRQYGVPIGSFQAVAHMLADASVHLEGARTTLLHAAWAVDSLDADDALAAAASAKAYASRAAREVCETAIQVHGGIGNTWECLAHVYLRRSLVSTAIFGGVGPNVDRVLVHAGVRKCDGLL